MRRLVISHTSTTVLSTASHMRGGQAQQQQLLPSSLFLRRKKGLGNAKASSRMSHVSSLIFLSPPPYLPCSSPTPSDCAAVCVQRRSVSTTPTANKAKKASATAGEAKVTTTTKHTPASTCTAESCATADKKVSAVQGAPIVTAKRPRKAISDGGGGSATSPRRHAATVVQVKGEVVDDPCSANNSTLSTALKTNVATGKQKKDTKGEEEKANDIITATTNSKKKCAAKSHKQQQAQSVNNNLSACSPQEAFFIPTATPDATITSTTARPKDGDNSGWSAVTTGNCHTTLHNNNTNANTTVGDDMIRHDDEKAPANDADADAAEGTSADIANMTTAATKVSNEQEASVSVVVSSEVASLHDPPQPHRSALSSEESTPSTQIKEHDDLLEEDGEEQIDRALAPILRDRSTASSDDTNTIKPSSSSLLEKYEDATGTFFFGNVPRAFLRKNELTMRRAIGGGGGDTSLQNNASSSTTGKRGSGYRGNGAVNSRDGSKCDPHVRFVKCWMCRALNKVYSGPQAGSSEDDAVESTGGSSDPWGADHKGEGIEPAEEGGGGGPRCERCGVPLSKPASFYGSSTNADAHRKESIEEDAAGDMDDAAILQQTSCDAEKDAANSPKRGDPLSPWREEDRGLIRRKATSPRRHATSQPHSGGGGGEGHNRGQGQGYDNPREHPHHRDRDGHQPQPRQNDNYGNNRSSSNPPSHPQRPNSYSTGGQGGGGGGSNHFQQQHQHQRNYPNNNYNTHTQQHQQRQQQHHTRDNHHRGHVYGSSSDSNDQYNQRGQQHKPYQQRYGGNSGHNGGNEGNSGGGYRREGGSGGAGYQPRPRGGAHY